MKVNGNLQKFYYYAFPMQAVLVTCNDKNGKTNAITIAWHTTISKDPPLYGISIAPNRYSHGLIQDAKEFVINFAPYEIADIVNFCGKNSGKNTDKITKMKLTLEPSQKLNTPIIKECFSHLECKLKNKLKLGDHTLFIGEVVNVIADKNAYLDDLLETEKIKPTYYIGGNIYTTISKKRDVFS
jgi:flavin reductase (DIM6/NTAB) family NADH-FMN oxidoreductase RutF